MYTILASTNRPHSNTLRVSKYYQKELKSKGFETELLSLESLPPGLADNALYGKEYKAFQEIQDLVSATSKFLFVIPEYNGSFPGILKLFIDKCKYPESFRDKKAALVGISNGKYGNIRGIEHFTGVCNYLGTHVLAYKVHIPYISRELDDDPNLFKEDVLRHVHLQTDKFIQF